MKITVTEKDLIGDIKDFPIEVVQKMVDEQVNQGNPPDVSVFQKRSFEDRSCGGFEWDEATDGDVFWRRVIVDKNFNLFFGKYPTDMKKKQHKHAELIKAWADGAEIEYLDKYVNHWYNTRYPAWKENIEYRIKLDPVYVSFEWEDRKELRAKWIKHKDGTNEMFITDLAKDDIKETLYINGEDSYYLFDEYTFMDDRPFGKLKED